MTNSQRETDYRKIPRSELNSNIPKGRGMVKWAPFATLPEQFERLHQYAVDQTKIDRPILSEDQINELNQKIYIAFTKHCPMKIRYFKEGWLRTLEIQPKKIDHLEQLLIGTDLTKQQPIQLSLLDIVQISLLKQ